MKRLMLAASLVLSSSIAFATTLQSLTQSQVNERIKGKTITTIALVTLDGATVNNTFTGYFNTDGTLNGRMENQPDNGPMADTGTWSTKSNGTLCATWQHWNNKQPTCVIVYKVNNGLLFINEKTHALETMILNANIKDGNQLG